MRLPKFTIHNCDVREGLSRIPDSSIDCICSSPPYFAQRNYGVDGQIGHESTSQEFVDTMVDIFYNHCYRVLKPHGLIFLNLGDSYNGSGGQGTQDGLPKVREYKEAWGEMKNSSKAGVLTKNDDSYKARDLMNIPHRVYEGLRQAGYYWRSTVIWEKSNGMPESVKGVRWERHRTKVRNIPTDETVWKKNKIKDHEGHSAGNHSEVEWKDCPGCKTCEPNDGYILRWGSGRPTNKYECIGILTKQDYYWDTEAVRTEYKQSSIDRRQYSLGSFGDTDGNGNRMSKEVDGTELGEVFTGANLGNVWEMPTAMFSEKHFATFPEELPEICIKAGSSEFGCCSECGKPYARILERVVNDYRTERYADGSGYDDRRKPNDIFAQAASSTIKTIGWKATCNHSNAEVVPSVVLDPFSGAGTTGLVANRLGRDYIGIELNSEYIEIAQKRIIGDAPLFYAMRSE